MTTNEYLDKVRDALSLLDEVRFRPMMGEYMIHYRDKYIACVCDNRLLVKPTVTAKSLLTGAPEELPYAGAKPMLRVLDIEDKAFLKKLFESMYDELPFPKPRKK